LAKSIGGVLVVGSMDFAKQIRKDYDFTDVYSLNQIGTIHQSHTVDQPIYWDETAISAILKGK
jgi:hypothetical protein